MNELTTEDYYGLFTDNVSLGPLFNWTNGTVNEKEEEKSTTLLVAAIYLTVVGFCAILGNITVLTIILRDKKLRSKPHNHLLISLAICDLSVLFLGYPFTIISAYSREWVFGALVCTFSGFFTFFISLTSMNILVAICVFRYVMICLPGKSFLLTPRFTMYVIMGCFAYGLFWTALPLLGWGSYAMEPFMVSCSLNWAKHDFSNLSYMVATIFFCYIGHVAIMVNCYRHISKTVTLLAQRDRERGRIVREDEMLYRSKVADDQQVTRMCFLVVIVFAGVWTPYALVSAVHIFYEDMPIYVTALPTMFAKAGCMMNPLVYFLTNRNFRVKAMEIIGCARMDNVVGVEMPNGEVVRTFDKLSKDGVYLGQDKVVMERSSTMF
ncbi:opsin-5 [Elysia marginata]|uniref:Opsin-5 n=1 Tax=Elysia marginata TaxID=1093978 RepID=A0AAV4GP81_9GAST|nr:opsin-5 [Elysia marginata]